MPGSDVRARPLRGKAELAPRERLTRRPLRLHERRRSERRWRDAPDSESLGGGGGRRQTTRRRILVADDELTLRALCRVNLIASGMDVLEARDGHEALELAAAERPDLILLDVMMPGPSGWEVAAMLAADERTREIPVVFLTARAECADRVRGRELGAVGYLTKPFDPVGLGDLVERTLERIANGEREQLRAEITDDR
jgi:CheY-like chemotaxis protein